MKASHDADSYSVSKEFLEDIRRDIRKENWLKWFPVIILGVLIIFFSITATGFFTLDNAKNLLNQLALPLIISVSVTFVIMQGGINLSIEGSIAMTGCIFSVLVRNSSNNNDFGFLAIPIILLLGLLSGFLMGFIHVKFRLPSFMVTYAFSFILSGVGLLSYGGIPATITDPFFEKFNTMEIFGIPFITLVALVVFVIALFIQKYTAFGQHIYAVGSNEKVLKSVGINVNKVKILVFSLSGLFLAVAGIVSVLRLGRGEVALGTGTMFSAFTAVVLGGTPMSGGRGGIMNTLIGAIILTVLQNGMVLVGVSSYVMDGIKGITIVIAVILTVQRGNRIINK